MKAGWEPSWQMEFGGQRFPEGLRWHDGQLYWSDVFAGDVFRAVPGQQPEHLGRVPNRPSGIGFTPDGTVMVVSMRDRSVVTLVDGVTTVHADLSALAGGDCNDMLVDPSGRAYVGNFGYDYAGGEERRAACLVLVEAGGSARIVAEDVWFPNGMVLCDDGRTLLLSETSAERVTAFTVHPDGSLTDRRTFEDVAGIRPDGIAMDVDGSLWVASPGTAEIVLFDRRGQVSGRWPAPGGMSQGCVFGGADGRTLFVACSPTHDLDESNARQGCIMSTVVPLPA